MALEFTFLRTLDLLKLDCILYYEENTQDLGTRTGKLWFKVMCFCVKLTRSGSVMVHFSCYLGTS